MQNVMCNAVIEFVEDGVRREDARKHRTTIGFNVLPDWVVVSDHFKLCTSGLNRMIIPFDGSSDKTLNNVESLQAENEALKQRLKALEEQKDKQQSFEEVMKTADDKEEDEDKSAKGKNKK